MNNERRIVKAMAYAGITVVVLGLLLVWAGFAKWWFDKTHLLGTFGIEMLVYAVWHAYLYKKETGESIWSR
jgi:hypothetical protein